MSFKGSKNSHFCPVHSIFAFWSNLPKTKNQLPAGCLKMTADFFVYWSKLSKKRKTKNGMNPRIIIKSYLYKKFNDRKGKFFLEFEKNLLYVYQRNFPFFMFIWRYHLFRSAERKLFPHGILQSNCFVNLRASAKTRLVWL